MTPFTSMGMRKTSSFTHDFAKGFDTYLVLFAVNSSYMERLLAIKGTVHKIKNQVEGQAKNS
jgi:hypothetical protein